MSDQENERAPDPVGQDAVEAVGPGDRALLRGVRRSRRDLANPAVAGARLDGRHRTARLSEPLPGGLDSSASAGPCWPDQDRFA